MGGKSATSLFVKICALVMVNASGPRSAIVKKDGVARTVANAHAQRTAPIMEYARLAAIVYA